jgi:imidazole glycerol-phosphate synthase subunit HisH
MIAVVDAGSGNLRSLCNALRRNGLKPGVFQAPPASPPEVIILPGVGAFGHSADQLQRLGWDRALKDFVSAGSRLVGICLGMQLLFESSEESPGARGLGFLRGTVRRLDASRAKVPHIGWESVRFAEAPRAALPWAYFVHSFAVAPEDPSIVRAWAAHGQDEFPAVVSSGRFVGVQFHPEKSQGPGVDYLASLVGGVT